MPIRNLCYKSSKEYMASTTQLEDNKSHENSVDCSLFYISKKPDSTVMQPIKVVAGIIIPKDGYLS